MAKKIFTDESLATFVDEIKSYTDESVSTKANLAHAHNDKYYTKTEVDTSMGQKSQVQIITWEDDD